MASSSGSRLNKYFTTAINVLKTGRPDEKLRTDERKSRLWVVMSNLMAEQGEEMDPETGFIPLDEFNAFMSNMSKDQTKLYRDVMQTQDQYETKLTNAKERELMNKTQADLDREMFTRRVQNAIAHNNYVDNVRAMHSGELRDYLNILMGKPVDKERLNGESDKFDPAYAALVGEYSENPDLIAKLKEVADAQKSYNDLSELMSPKAWEDFKTKHNSVLSELETKHSNQLADLKSKYESSIKDIDDADKLAELENKYKSDVSGLNTGYDSKVKELTTGFDSMMDALKAAHYAKPEYQSAFPSIYDDTIKGNRTDFSKIEQAKAKLDALNNDFSNMQHGLESEFWRSNYPEAQGYVPVPKGGADFKKKSLGDYAAQFIGRGGVDNGDLIYKLQGPQTRYLWLTRDRTPGLKYPRYVIHQASRRMDWKDKNGKSIPFDKSDMPASKYFVTDTSNDRRALDFSGYAPAFQSVQSADNNLLVQDENGDWVVNPKHNFMNDYDQSDEFIKNYMTQFLADTLPGPRNQVLPRNITDEDVSGAQDERFMKDIAVLGDVESVMKKWGMSQDALLRKLDARGLAADADTGMIYHKENLPASQRMEARDRKSIDEMLEQNEKSEARWKELIEKHPELEIGGTRTVQGKSRSSDGKQAGGGFSVTEVYSKNALGPDGKPLVLKRNGAWTDEARKILGWQSKEEAAAKRAKKKAAREKAKSKLVDKGATAADNEVVKEAKAVKSLVNKVGKKNVSAEGIKKAEDTIAASKAATQVANAMASVGMTSKSGDPELDRLLGFSDDQGVEGDKKQGDAVADTKDNTYNVENKDDTGAVNGKSSTPVNKNVVKGVKGEEN